MSNTHKIDRERHNGAKYKWNNTAHIHVYVFVLYSTKFILPEGRNKK